MAHPEALPGLAGHVAHVERPAHGSNVMTKAQWVEHEPMESLSLEKARMVLRMPNRIHGAT